MKSWPKVKLGKVGVSSIFAQNCLAYRKLYLAIIGPNSHEQLTKYEIRSLLVAPICGPKIPCFSIFSLTYLHLPLFTYIWPNVVLITLI